MELCYCFLEKFNNYFNRKIIKYESINDYVDHSKDSFIPVNSDGSISKFNFNPNDNVTTEIIANNVPFDPDYFLLIDKDQNIQQRWFILEQKRNREGQWVYSLKRDVISDNFNTLLKAPIFVQKGMLKETDPMIFNSEGMDFNQIKKSEFLLKDLTEASWIVCYLAKSLTASDVSVDTPATEIPIEYYTLSQIATELGIAESELASVLNINPGDSNVLVTNNNFYMSFALKPSLISYTYEKRQFTASSDFKICNSGIITPIGITSYWLIETILGTFNNSTFAVEVVDNANELLSSIPTVFSRTYYLQYQLANEVLSRYNGKTILYLGNYYTLNVSQVGTQTVNKTFKTNQYPEWDGLVREALANNHIAGGDAHYNESNGELYLEMHEVNLSLTLTAQTTATSNYKLNIPTSRKVCEKQEFDMIAIPASNLDVYYLGNTIKQDGNLAQMIASALAIKEGTNIYDIQLLPFCPAPDLIVRENLISLDYNTPDVDFSYIRHNVGGVETNVGVVLYLDKASFTNRINKTLNVVEGNKIDSQCNFYRLVSPNYQGVFEFNVAKNGGTVQYFNIYCTYKPYTPFIKVVPNFSYLYGQDFNDNRGLICGGDFSLPRASSAWEQYQLENKNYQNIFNREIQNMNFMQSIEARNQRITGAVGILGDSVKGATAGGIAGGPWGAVAGGIIGAGLSGVGYAVDMDTLAKTQRETRQLAIDKYNYQLGNIKALPYTLTKVGAFDVSSKIFPFLEYYTCTDVEKEALRNKIEYESMTVMRIGTLEEFKDFEGRKTYFKGELIRNDEIADDPHTLNAIYEEFLKGVYI